MERVQHECDYPLLRATEGNVTMWYVYRSAEAGPDSQPIRVCPKCGGVLDVPNVREVMMDNIERTQRMSRQITTIDDFERMLVRRGYQWSLLTASDIQSEQAGLLWYYVQRKSGGEGWKIDFNAFAAYRSLLEVEREIDNMMGLGCHHMQCKCGEPILRNIQFQMRLEWSTGGYQEPHFGYPSHVYYLVSAGPDSEPIDQCPKCGLLLDVSAKEIED